MGSPCPDSLSAGHCRSTPRTSPRPGWPRGASKPSVGLPRNIVAVLFLSVLKNRGTIQCRPTWVPNIKMGGVASPNPQAGFRIDLEQPSQSGDEKRLVLTALCATRAPSNSNSGRYRAPNREREAKPYNPRSLRMGHDKTGQ